MVINLIGSLAVFRQILSVRIPYIVRGYAYRSQDRNDNNKLSYMFYFSDKRHRLSWTFSNQIRVNSYLVTLDYRVSPFEFRIKYQGILSGTSIPGKFLELVYDTEIYFRDRTAPKKEDRRNEKGKAG